MRDTELIDRTEAFVKGILTSKVDSLLGAHDFKHVNRVRRIALHISQVENYHNIMMVELAALLHDVGLAHLKDGDDRRKHGALGSVVSKEYLEKQSALEIDDIEIICDAITYHSLHPDIVKEHLQELGDRGQLLKILRDADMLDAMGAMGVMRAIVTKYYLPDYDPANIKGTSWCLSAKEYRVRFKQDLQDPVLVKTIVDQINQQIRYYEYLHTQTARDIGKPLVEYMRNFIIQLDSEITLSE